MVLAGYNFVVLQNGVTGKRHSSGPKIQRPLMGARFFGKPERMERLFEAPIGGPPELERTSRISTGD